MGIILEEMGTILQAYILLQLMKKVRETFHTGEMSRHQSLFFQLTKSIVIDNILNSDILYYSGITASIIDKAQQIELIKLGASASISAFDFNYRDKLHFNKKEAQLLFKDINNNVNIHFI